MSWIVRWTCGPASGWNDSVSAPASTKAGISGSTGVIMRCTSNSFFVCLRNAFSTTGPIVRLGTKWLSITSTWIQSAPAASMASTSWPSAEKSADRMEGAMRTGFCGMESSSTGARRCFPAFAAERMGRESAERLELAREELQLLQRKLQAALLGMAFDLGIELGLLEMRAAQIALELHDVDAVGGEAAQRLVERGRHALHPEQEGRHAGHGTPVRPRLAAAEHQHARGVVVGILDVLGQHLQPIDPRRQRGGDGAYGEVADLGDLARGARGVGMDQRLEPVLLQKVAALGQRLDMALHRLDGLEQGAGQRHQAMLDPLEMLGDDLELGVRQEAVQVRDAAGDRILDRNHGQFRVARLDRRHRRFEGRARQRGHVRKGCPAGHIGVGAGFPLERDRIAGLALAELALADLGPGHIPTSPRTNPIGET